MSGVQPHEQTLTIRRRETTVLSLNESVDQLTEIRVLATKGLHGRETLPNVTPTAIFAGKKTKVINLGALDTNLVTNNTRQIFSKTPGVTGWENDGLDVQVGVAVRGLSPNQS